MKRGPGRTLRGRLTVAGVLVAALALLVLTVTFNVVLHRSLRDDVQSRLHSRAQAALATIIVRENRVTTSETAGDAALDSGIWIYQGTRNVERPAAARALHLTADSLAGGPARAVDAPGGGSRLYALPLNDDGHRVGTVVAATSLAAYDRTTRLALVASVLFALAMLLAVAGVSWLIVGAALSPVREMTEQAAEWSDRDLDRRFGAGDRPDELGALAETFDALLDRISASLRQEQRMSAELSHELRTPLAKVIAEADLLLRRPHPPEEQREALEVIRRSAERMTGILETLMAAARSEAHTAAGRSDMRQAAERAAEHVRPQAGARDVVIRVAGGAPIIVGADAEVAERVLAPIVDNAWRHADGAVDIDVSRGDGRIIVEVRDDGSGVPTADVERIFEPGVTGGNGHDGAGLGLPLSRRLARAAGGDVHAVAEPAGGRFRVDLPAG